MSLGWMTNRCLGDLIWSILERKGYFIYHRQGCIFRLTCSHPELTKDHVLTSAYVKIFRTVTRNAVNKSVWRKKDCSWLPLNKHAMNIWLSFLRIRAHLSWRTGKTSPCSPRAPNLLHVLPSRMVGWHDLCSPGHWCFLSLKRMENCAICWYDDHKTASQKTYFGNWYPICWFLSLSP